MEIEDTRVLFRLGYNGSKGFYHEPERVKPSQKSELKNKGVRISVQPTIVRKHISSEKIKPTGEPQCLQFREF